MLLEASGQFRVIRTFTIQSIPEYLILAFPQVLIISKNDPMNFTCQYFKNYI